MSQAESQSTEQPTARLLVQKGPQPNQIFDLSQELLTIGRSSANDISITDPEISRKHSRLVKQGTDYAIEDLGSTNGTFVNERRIVGLTPLHDGDIIEFGEAVRLLYEAESTLPVDVPVPPLPQPEPEPAPPEPVEVEAEPEPQRPAPRPVPPQVPAAPAYAPAPNPINEEETDAPSCRRNALLGCGAIILLLFLCTATLFFLDAYQQGRLLYCGPLQSFWELILGPFGFAPLCS
jgi:pSer/pThr/pTyr-binding forkhead associated (FHA) protein